MRVESGPRCLKLRQMCTKVMASVNENTGLKIKASIPIIIKIPEIQASLPRNQDQGDCHPRQINETRTVCLELIRAKILEINANVHKNHGQCTSKSWASNQDQYLYIMPQYPAIQANVPRNQNNGVCYHKQMPETRKACMESGLRCMKSTQMCTEIRSNMLEINANVYRD